MNLELFYFSHSFAFKWLDDELSQRKSEESTKVRPFNETKKNC